MVIPQHQSRALFWDGASGMATLPSMQLTLSKAPRVLGRVVARIDYTPVHGVWLVMDDAPPFAWRTMSRSEREDADKKLEAMRDVGLKVWE